MNNNVVNFTDQERYNAEMAKSAYDKLGFVDKIFEPISAIIDFGCANGAVTELIRTFYATDSTIIIGFDLPEIIENNKNNYEKNIGYTSSFEELEYTLNKWTKGHKGRVLLVMNSVVHEIYNYVSVIERRELFNKLFSLPIDYIWFRDMYIIEQLNTTLTTKIRIPDEYLSRFSDFINFYHIPYTFSTSPLMKKDLVHFFLKCRYKNWDKELKEDYSILSQSGGYENFLKVLNTYNFNIVATKNYVLPYLENINKKDFNISIEDDLEMFTHKWALFYR